MKNFSDRLVLSQVWQVHAVGLGGFLVMTILGYLVGVSPLVQQAGAARTQKQQLVEASQQADRLTLSRGNLKQKLDNAQHAIAAGTFQLRSIKQLNRYLAQLTQLATASGLTLHEIQPGNAVRGEHYWSVPIEMSGTGRYRTCARFLHGLHKGLSDTRLSSLQLTASSSAAHRPDATFRLGLVWHAAPN